MESEVLKYAMSQGLWAVLFVALLFYVLKQQEKRDIKADEREKEYQSTISKNQGIIQELAENLNVVEEVKRDVEDIKSYVFKKEV